jgi:hypothetical protein
MSNNTIPIDIDRENKRYLLRQLSVGLLDRDGAIQLKPLLQREAQNISSLIHKKRLFAFDKYIRHVYSWKS